MHGRPVSTSSLRRQEKFLSSPYEEKEIHRGACLRGRTSSTSFTNLYFYFDFLTFYPNFQIWPNPHSSLYFFYFFLIDNC